MKSVTTALEPLESISDPLCFSEWGLEGKGLTPEAEVS